MLLVLSLGDENASRRCLYDRTSRRLGNTGGGTCTLGEFNDVEQIKL